MEIIYNNMAVRWMRCLTLCALSSMVTLAEQSGVPAKPTNLTADSRMEPSADHGLIATLRWKVPPSTSPLNYYVRYRDEKASNSMQKIARKTNARIFLKPNSHYVVTVIAFDANNPKLKGPWSDELKIQTGNSVPTHSPLNVTITTVTSSSILVKWSPIPQGYRNGKLLGYIVFYTTSKTKRWKTKVISGPNELQYTITGLKAGESYIVAVAGYTKIGVGKKSNPVTVDRSLPTTRPQSTTFAPSPTQETTVQPITTEVPTTPTYVNNHVPKPTTEDKLVTYEMSIVHSETAPVHEIETTEKPPNAQANKDAKPEKRSSTTLVYKFIIPAVIGSLVLVLLIVCIMWRKRKAKKRHQAGDTIRLTTLGETNKKEKTRCAVTRGEGSIRYAPPPKSYNTSAPPSQDADPQQGDKLDETRTTLSVISENEPSKSTESTSTQTQPSTKARQPYAEVTIVGNDKDERYVKRNDAAATTTASGYTVPNNNQPVPSSPCKSTTSSEAGYENMQHLYDFIDVKDDKGSPLYMNIGTSDEEGEGLYEEIPADCQDNVTEERDEQSAVQQPLLNNQALDENGKTAV